MKYRDPNDFSDSNFKTINIQTNDRAPIIIGLIMVKNQEVKIVKTIKLIKNICDKIIVVDTGSTDNTVKNIQNEFPDVIIRKIKWIENYSLMRNKCLSFIRKGDWVFCVDSDEYLDSNLSYEVLHQFVYNIDSKYPGYDIACTVKQNLSSLGSFVRSKRIFKKTDTIYYFGYVHEELRSKNAKQNLKIDTDIVFNNTGTSVEDINKFSKAERYSKLLLKNIELEPNNPRWISLVTPDYIELGLISNSKYQEQLEKNIFKNINNKVFLKENIRSGPYLKYLLEQFCLLMISKQNWKIVKECADFADSIFPYDVNFVMYNLSTFFSYVESTSQLYLNEIISRYSNVNETEVDEESQGSEEALSALLVRLFILTHNYDKAREIYLNIKDPMIKDALILDSKILE
ncbi:glycosyltransferase [Lactobacillus sp. DCY120]|uniref:Glycosyltransferase n=1 Tax=Bombilactobacillus apium TaxID=2675299 RepID=A0A850R0F4_9LACO|nr:glycosyltransferase [Bombilactobacillus apium]NVY96539.1 glycosyltransferase [Bombilactobacillus apium]